MPQEAHSNGTRLTGHALRNAHLLEKSLQRACAAPPLAKAVVRIRAGTLGMTRLEFVRRSGISRGTMRDLELGIHTPARHTLQEFVDFCKTRGVAKTELDALCRLYTGPGETLGQWISRLELRAGGTRELARRAGISPATLWEYRRGNFPLPLALLRKLCRSVGENPAPAQALWHAAERRRLIDRGYPEPWAELCVWCFRQEHTESHVLTLGVTTTAFRRLRYLELPPWREVASAAKELSRDEDEWLALQKLWIRSEHARRERPRDEFGPRVKQLREERGVSRRELADLFRIGGRKPARIVKHIEEDGLYSAQCYPAAHVAVLTDDFATRERLLNQWRDRRRTFHRRHRPEMRLDLRLERELFGFSPADMVPVLGYSSLEYQRIERGVGSLSDSARARILQAIRQAGQQRVAGLLERRRLEQGQRGAWRTPATAPELVKLLIRREGGLIPLTRRLREAGVPGLWPGRLRAMADGSNLPAWPVLQGIAQSCGVTELDAARRDWAERYRIQLQRACTSPLAVELRLLIAGQARNLREFSPRLGVNYSVLVREFQRIDRDEPLRWFHLERLLRALEVRPESEHWRNVRALWVTAATRRKTRAARIKHNGTGAGSKAYG